MFSGIIVGVLDGSFVRSTYVNGNGSSDGSNDGFNDGISLFNNGGTNVGRTGGIELCELLGSNDADG